MHHTTKRQPDSHLDTPALELRWREVSIASRSSCSSSTIMEIEWDGFGPPRAAIRHQSLLTRASRFTPRPPLPAARVPRVGADRGLRRFVSCVQLSVPEMHLSPVPCGSPSPEPPGRNPL